MNKETEVLKKSSLLKLIIFFCLFLSITFFSCAINQPDTSETQNSNNITTWAEFKNMEQFPVIVYGDSLRQNKVIEIPANETKKIEAVPNIIDVVYYPTFHFDLFDLPDVFISYNAPPIITTIKENKTNLVSIAKLESVDIYNSYIKIINNSNASLTFKQGDIERTPISSIYSIILSNESAVYEILPGNSSGYSIMRNTITPTAFPAGLNEFRRGIIYILTYDGTKVTLIEEKSLLQTIPPDVPKNVSLEVISDASVRVIWEPVYGATTYRIYRASGTANSVYNKIGSTSAYTYTDTDIPAGQRCFYKVTALSGIINESGKSESTSVILAPGNLHLIETTTLRIKIGWNTATEATKYNIYKYFDTIDRYEKIDTISEISYTDNNVEPDKTYYYKVSSIVDDNESLISIPITVSTLQPIPVNVKATIITTINTKIEWDLIRGSSGYNIYRSTDNGVSYTKLNSEIIAEHNYADSNLLPNTGYYYKVSSINNGIESFQSSSIYVNTLSPIPTNLQAFSNSTNKINLSWNIVSEASGYNIYRSIDENGTFIKINPTVISQTEYSDDNVTPFTAYYYKISAIIINIEREKSNHIMANTGIKTVGNGLDEKLNWLQINTKNNTTYGIEISNDETISTQNLAYNGKIGITIIIYGNDINRTINLSNSEGTIFTIGSSVTLILDKNITIAGKSTNSLPLVRINNNGRFQMNSSTRIINNRGNGVYLTGGIFILNGGEISGNNNSEGGGGVYITSGSFTMENGKITNNIAGYGGGVLIEGGNFIMNNGEISNNTSTATGNPAFGGGGGGVTIIGGTFTMNNGKISGNIAYNGGGGVIIGGGVFTMKSGEISGNIATGTSIYDGGGGVYVGYDATAIFRISGGVIYGKNEPEGFKNSDALYHNQYSDSRSQYGTFNGDNFRANGTLNSTNTTIRIVNGNLQTN